MYESWYIKMKIIQINSVCGYGSTGRIVTDLYEMIESQGAECLAIYGRGDSPKGINAIKVSSNFDNKIHGIRTRLTGRHGFGSASATKKLIDIVRKDPPDIIHLHNIHGYYLNIEILFRYLKEVDIPVVWTLHDCWSFTGHCSHFDYIGCQRWKKKCYHCPQKSQYPKSILFDSSLRNYEQKKYLFTSLKRLQIVTPSVWLQGMVQQSFLKKCPVKVIYNGIDLNIFKPINQREQNIRNIKRKYGCEGKFTMISVASVWAQRKGLEFIIATANRLGEEFRFIIVGVDEKKSTHFPPNVIGISRTNDLKQLAEIYSMADLFVNPTLEEVLGLTNLEALACGTPVVTFDTGGSPECIDSSTGIVVRKGSVDSLINGILFMKEQRFSREACRNRAKGFDKNDKYGDYMKLYKDILNQKQ